MPFIGPGLDNGYRSRFIYTATAGQTSFSGGDDNGITLTYTDSEYLDVYQNGVLLVPGDDYAATTGTTVVLVQGASLNDKVEMIQYQAFGVADTVSRADGGAFGGNISTSGTLAVTGTSTLTGALSAKGGAVFNEDSADVDFRVESNGNANMLFVDGGNDIVGIGVVPTAQFSHNIIQIGNQASLGANAALSTTGQTYLTHNLYYNTDGNLRVFNTSSANEGAILQMVDGIFKFSNSSATTGTPTVNERMRLDSSGRALIGTTQTNVISVDGRHGIVLNDKTNGFYLGVGQFSSNGNASMLLNRDSDDGSIQLFFQDASEIGSISTSGSTVSYNAFSASHWSRLTDNSKPTILKGTIIETIDEMCDWYQAEFTVTEEEDGKTINRTAKNSIALPDGKSVGDTITHTFEGKDYTAKIIKEADNKHTKCKISDTADSKRVYGVYAAWDNDDDTVNDMYVTAVGTHVVRINKDVTVSAGDLLSSNGDGTAKVQDDDIIRSKTIGKVLTNIKQETYSDGSYTVPCALYCG
jgi:prepilin-type processing-associated H-X9-DG protein